MAICRSGAASQAHYPSASSSRDSDTGRFEACPMCGFFRKADTHRHFETEEKPFFFGGDYLAESCFAARQSGRHTGAGAPAAAFQGTDPCLQITRSPRAAYSRRAGLARGDRRSVFRYRAMAALFG